MTISSISSLIIIKPTSNYAAGEPFEIRVVLDVNDSNQFSRSYTAVFSCAVGAYQLSTLAFNHTYPVITPGIYGLVTLAVTATGCQTAFYTFTISPAVPNYPPTYTPAQLPLLTNPFPAIYSHFNENGKAEIDAVAYFSSQDEALLCISDSQCSDKHIKRLAH